MYKSDKDSSIVSRARDTFSYLVLEGYDESLWEHRAYTYNTSNRNGDELRLWMSLIDSEQQYLLNICETLRETSSLRRVAARNLLQKLESELLSALDFASFKLNFDEENDSSSSASFYSADEILLLVLESVCFIQYHLECSDILQDRINDENKSNNLILLGEDLINLVKLLNFALEGRFSNNLEGGSKTEVKKYILMREKYETSNVLKTLLPESLPLDSELLNDFCANARKSLYHQLDHRLEEFHASSNTDDDWPLNVDDFFVYTDCTTTVTVEKKSAVNPLESCNRDEFMELYNIQRSFHRIFDDISNYSIVNTAIRMMHRLTNNLLVEYAERLEALAVYDKEDNNNNNNIGWNDTIENQPQYLCIISSIFILLRRIMKYLKLKFKPNVTSGLKILVENSLLFLDSFLILSNSTKKSLNNELCYSKEGIAFGAATFTIQFLEEVDPSICFQVLTHAFDVLITTASSDKQMSSNEPDISRAMVSSCFLQLEEILQRNDFNSSIVILCLMDTPLWIILSMNCFNQTIKGLKDVGFCFNNTSGETLVYRHSVIGSFPILKKRGGALMIPPIFEKFLTLETNPIDFGSELNKLIDIKSAKSLLSSLKKVSILIETFPQFKNVLETSKEFKCVIFKVLSVEPAIAVDYEILAVTMKVLWSMALSSFEYVQSCISILPVIIREDLENPKFSVENTPQFHRSNLCSQIRDEIYMRVLRLLECIILCEKVKIEDKLCKNLLQTLCHCMSSSRLFNSRLKIKTIGIVSFIITARLDVYSGFESFCRDLFECSALMLKDVACGSVSHRMYSCAVIELLIAATDPVISDQLSHILTNDICADLFEKIRDIVSSEKHDEVKTGAFRLAYNVSVILFRSGRESDCRSLAENYLSLVELCVLILKKKESSEVLKKENLKFLTIFYNIFPTAGDEVLFMNEVLTTVSGMLVKTLSVSLISSVSWLTSSLCKVDRSKSGAMYCEMLETLFQLFDDNLQKLQNTFGLAISSSSSLNYLLQQVLTCVKLEFGNVSEQIQDELLPKTSNFIHGNLALFRYFSSKNHGKEVQGQTRLQFTKWFSITLDSLRILFSLERFNLSFDHHQELLHLIIDMMVPANIGSYGIKLIDYFAPSFSAFILSLPGIDYYNIKVMKVFISIFLSSAQCVEYHKRIHHVGFYQAFIKVLDSMEVITFEISLAQSFSELLVERISEEFSRSFPCDLLLLQRSCINHAVLRQSFIKANGLQVIHQLLHKIFSCRNEDKQLKSQTLCILGMVYNICIQLHRDEVAESGKHLWKIVKLIVDKDFLAIVPSFTENESNIVTDIVACLCRPESPLRGSVFGYGIHRRVTSTLKLSLKNLKNRWSRGEADHWKINELSRFMDILVASTLDDEGRKLYITDWKSFEIILEELVTFVSRSEDVKPKVLLLNLIGNLCLDRKYNRYIIENTVIAPYLTRFIIFADKDIFFKKAFYRNLLCVVHSNNKALKILSLDKQFSNFLSNLQSTSYSSNADENKLLDFKLLTRCIESEYINLN